jgi:protein-S-isoprenylcysteine O-methyltransferase Ste14
VAAGAVVVVGIARRAVLEERVLADELPGYAEYMTRVRSRFLPLLW